MVQLMRSSDVGSIATPPFELARGGDLEALSQTIRVANEQRMNARLCATNSTECVGCQRSKSAVLKEIGGH